MSTKRSRSRKGSPQSQRTQHTEGLRADEIFETVPLIVEMDMIAYRWLEVQGKLCGLQPEKVLTLLADIGRNMLEHDHDHPVVMDQLRRAGFSAVKASEGFYYDTSNGTIVRG